MITHHHINKSDNLYALIGSATINLGYVTGTRNIYTATPAGLTPGVHSYAIYLRAGSNPAITDTLLAAGEIIINNEPAIIAKIDAVNAKLPADTTDKINRLDANVSTRLAASDYSEPDNAKIAQLKTAIDAVNAKLPADTTNKINRLDANVSTRLAASDYSEPDNAKIAEAKTTIDQVKTVVDSTSALATEIKTSIVSIPNQTALQVNKKINPPKIFTQTIQTQAGSAIDNVRCILTLDSEGTSALAESITDSTGKVLLHHNAPDNQTAWLWRYKTGISFSNPQQVTL